MSKEQDAVEEFQSEKFTLSQYLKDYDMNICHGERFKTMIEALSLAINIIPEYVELKKLKVTREYKCGYQGFVPIEKYRELQAQVRTLEAEKKGKTKIVCLCGSTRFMQAFFDAGWDFTLKGYIVLSVGVCKHAEHHGAEALGGNVAEKLDELHLRKIDLADEVFVLNVDGYLGKSTIKEIEYAIDKNKPISYLEP